MAVNWNLGLTVAQPQGNALDAFQAGRDQRRQRDADNALKGYAANPSEQTLAPVIQSDPRLGLQLRSQQAAQQKAQNEQRSVQTQQLGRLLNHATDEATYQQSIQAARGLGIDVTGAPPQFDPAWIGQQKLMLQAFGGDNGEKISGLARELQDAGYDLSTPDGQAALRSVISNKYASEYVDEQGNTRRRSGLDLGGGMQAPPTIQNTPAPAVGENGMPATLTPEQYQAIVAQKGAQATQEWAQRNGITISKSIGGQTYYQVNGQWYDNPEGR